MILGNKTTNEIYKDLYKELQKDWKKESKELMVVSRLAYWTFWISKLAESSKDKEERKQLFALKAKGLILLSKSEYVQLRKYIPPFHKKMCWEHSNKQRKTLPAHKYIVQKAHQLNNCPKCQNGEEYYFSIYSIAVLNKKEDVENRKPLFIMNAPYGLLKNDLPDIDSLESVKYFNGSEYLIHEVGKPMVTKVNKNAFSKEMILKYFNKNYKTVSEYYKNIIVSSCSN